MSITQAHSCFDVYESRSLLQFLIARRGRANLNISGRRLDSSRCITFCCSCLISCHAASDRLPLKALDSAAAQIACEPMSVEIAISSFVETGLDMLAQVEACDGYILHC